VDDGDSINGITVTACMLALLSLVIPVQVEATNRASITFVIDYKLNEPKEVNGPFQTKPKVQVVVKKTARQINIAQSEVVLARLGHKFAPGYCTDYVARKLVIPWGGNANQWIANSKPYGAIVDRIPAVGAIIVTNESRFGHVGYIEATDGGLVTFSEWNYAGKYKKTTRTLNINDKRIKGIIHL